MRSSSFKVNSASKIKPGSVVWGSHRNFDLIFPMLNLLLGHYLYNEDGKLQEIQALYKEIPEEALNDDCHPFWQSEECQYLMDDVFNAMNEAAPEGYYFGAHEGDGADFGYWPVER